MPTVWLLAALATFAGGIVWSTACTNANLQLPPASLNNADRQLTISGQVCTEPPDPTGFPVKVVFIVDQSGSMCVSDPPGSQCNGSGACGANGFCEMANTTMGVNPAKQPARVVAIDQLLQQWVNQSNVYVALVPFETNVQQDYVWPPLAQPGAPGTFGKLNPTTMAQLQTQVSQLQGELGKGTDYQGALSYTYNLISADIANTQLTNPALLPRTRYVVVFLTDGTPYPKCAAPPQCTPLDPLPCGDPTHPWLIWPDSSDAVDFCNGSSVGNNPSDTIQGFDGGVDRNQNYQLFAYVDELMTLKTQYNVGDVRLDTILLFNQTGVDACGTLCYGLYGDFSPDPAINAADAEYVAGWLLQQMSTRGNGVFQEFKNGQIQNMGLGGLDYTSLASPYAMKTLILQDLTSTPMNGQRAVDSDGDALDDTRDNSFTVGTNPYNPDSDGDCFDDNFEVLHSSEGFNPLVPDLRGCDPSSPAAVSNCPCTDIDGDGVSDQQEAYLKSNNLLVDSDADGIPDWLETRYGLDPTRSNVGLDTDGDGNEDLAEVRAGTNPSQPDSQLFTQSGYQYTTTQVAGPNGETCYNFTITNVDMHTPPPHAGQTEGYNLFKLWFSEAPQSGVATDYGNWKAACIWAQYSPPSVRIPAGPSITVQDSNFTVFNTGLAGLDSPAAYLTNCVGTPP
jgi:hypothetical protein